MKLVQDGSILDPHLKSLRDRYPFEPYRLALIGLRDRVREAERRPRSPRWLLDFNGGEARTGTLKTAMFRELLDLIAVSLKSHRAALLAEGELHRLRNNR